MICDNCTLDYLNSYSREIDRDIDAGLSTNAVKQILLQNNEMTNAFHKMMERYTKMLKENKILKKKNIAYENFIFKTQDKEMDKRKELNEQHFHFMSIIQELKVELEEEKTKNLLQNMMKD